MKLLMTIMAMAFTVQTFAGDYGTYGAEEIMKDIRSYQMTGKTSEELGHQVKYLMRTQKVSKEQAIELLKKYAQESQRLFY